MSIVSSSQGFYAKSNLEGLFCGYFMQVRVLCMTYKRSLINMPVNTENNVFLAEKVFHVVDYCVFGIVILVSLCIGLWHAFTGGKQKTTKEFLLADRNLCVLPAALSMMVCESMSMTWYSSMSLYHYHVYLLPFDHTFTTIQTIVESLNMW